MTPFEAGQGTGLEAVVGSGKEARGEKAPLTGPQLIVISALDENNWYPQAGPDLDALRLRHTDALDRGIRFRVGVLDYIVNPADDENDVIWPQTLMEIPFPSDVVTVLGEELQRVFPPDNPDSGPIVEGPEQWEAWIEELWTEPSGAGTRVTIILDDSGSMLRSDFRGVPLAALNALAVRFPFIEIRLRSESDERWVGWMWQAYDEYIRDHPEIP